MGVYEDCNSLNGKIDKELKACEARLREMESGVEKTLDPRAERGGGTQGDDMLARCKRLAALHKPYHAFVSKYWNELKGNSTPRRIRKAESKQKKLETEVLTISQEIADNTDAYVKAVDSGDVKEAIHKQVSKSIGKTGHAFYRTKKGLEIDSKIMRKARGFMRTSRKKIRAVKAQK